MLAVLDELTSASAAYSRPAELCVATSVARVGFVSRPANRWKEVVRALEPLRRLRDDWDGLGAAAPPADLVDSAIELASYLGWREAFPPTAVTPTPAGTIVFTWDGPEYFEIEITSPYQAEWMRVDATGKATHGEGVPI
jgi:hypothetical protein